MDPGRFPGVNGCRNPRVRATVYDGFHAVGGQSVLVRLIRLVFPHRGLHHAFHLQDPGPYGVRVAAAGLIHAFGVSLPEFLVRLPVPASNDGAGVRHLYSRRHRGDDGRNSPRRHVALRPRLAGLDGDGNRPVLADDGVLQRHEPLAAAGLHQKSSVDFGPRIPGYGDRAGGLLGRKPSDADKCPHPGKGNPCRCIQKSAIVSILRQLPQQAGEPGENPKKNPQRAADAEIDGASKQLFGLDLVSVQQIKIRGPKESFLRQAPFFLHLCRHLHIDGSSVFQPTGKGG